MTALISERHKQNTSFQLTDKDELKHTLFQLLSHSVSTQKLLNEVNQYDTFMINAYIFITNESAKQYLNVSMLCVCVCVCIYIYI